ncbi:hypothetical protein OG426_54770 (plasmid) [Streptomyces canus]|uniref:hypothetical protein n=1 Tax=Streptomyces canus TaxID=58343 RepID=UPI002F9115FF|nr:hypothetical protein OG426_54770 [Streptomyces canus]
MIPAEQPYEARYKHEKNGKATYTSKPVIAWDDDGQALIVDERTGRLVPASNDGSFLGVSEGQHPVVAAIPGAGWRARYKNPDGTTTTDPLLAWIVRSDGSLTPIDTDLTGLADDVTGVGNFDGLEPPAVQPPVEADGSP